MILKEKDYAERLDAFVDAYLLQQRLMEADVKDDCELTEAVLQYMQVSRELCEFVQEVYGEEEPALPRMDVFYHNGTYHDFAYQMYLAVRDAGQLHENDLWRNYTMVHIGERLRQKQEERHEQGYFNGTFKKRS